MIGATHRLTVNVTANRTLNGSCLDSERLLIWVFACILREIAFLVFPSGGVAFLPCFAAFVLQLFQAVHGDGMAEHGTAVVGCLFVCVDLSLHDTVCGHITLHQKSVR